MNNVLEINNLSKNFGNIRAVNNLSLEVNSGDIYGILGPNGSGKTTTLGIILGVIRASKGSYTWFGKKADSQNRKKIGSILETPNFYPYLSAYKNLQITADIKGVSYNEIESALKTVNLLDRKSDPVSDYSLGMKQRLALAGALLGEPEVLVLDEPTNGLDPQGIADVRGIIQKTAKDGKTIIIASHILDEVEKICTHVAVIKKGNLLSAGSIQKVLNKEEKIDISSEKPDELENIFKDYKGVKNITRNRDIITLSVDDTVMPAEINKFLFERGIILTHLSVSHKSLESLFLELTAE